MPPVTGSSSKRKRSRNRGKDNDSTMLLNDLVTLPIIISDYDAENPVASFPSTDQGDQRSIGTTASDTTSPKFTHYRWRTGFSDFADELWNQMTSSMKHKLRSACMEVLKRTDDRKEDQNMCWQHDHDARFLD